MAGKKSKTDENESLDDFFADLESFMSDDPDDEDEEAVSKPKKEK